MKKNLLLFFLASFIFASLTSCDKDDEPKVDPIVGEWSADKITISGLPAKYKSYEGSLLPQVFGILQYTFVFKSDKSFEVDIREDDGTISEGKGTWVNNNGTYTLDSDQTADDTTISLADNKISIVENVTLNLTDPNDENVKEQVPAVFTIVFKKSQ